MYSSHGITRKSPVVIINSCPCLMSTTFCTVPELWTLNSPYKTLILSDINLLKYDFDSMFFKRTFKLWKYFSFVCLLGTVFSNLLSFFWIDIHRWNISCICEIISRVLALLWVLSFSISSYSLKCAFFSLKKSLWILLLYCMLNFCLKESSFSSFILVWIY